MKLSLITEDTSRFYKGVSEYSGLNGIKQNRLTDYVGLKFWDGMRAGTK